MYFRFWFSLFISLISYCSCANDKFSNFIIGSVPSWVISYNQDLSKIPTWEPAYGIHCLLFDKQTKKEKETICYFTHIVKKVVNQNGIDSAAHLEIEFDPLCDSIVLHQVNVKRDKRTIDHLSSANIKILQREKELDQKIYSGIKSLNIILDDIRVGDIIDYSFTIRSSEPNINKSFSKKIQFSSYIPVYDLKQRILWPRDQTLIIKNHSTNLKPEIKQLQNYTEYLWSQKNLSLIKNEPDTPLWYDDDPWIEVSEKHTWHEINLSLSKRYKVNPVSSSALQKYIDNIAKTTQDLGERFISLMRFIQDDIRYMGLSDRIDGFLPEKAEVVFSRRFGDCKDKSFLAVTMLRALRIEAYPAVVHTSHGKRLNDLLPNSSVFDHVIVVALINGKKYWIDPTITFQGGTIDQYVQPDYGYALILDDKSDNLTKIPQSQLMQPTLEIFETYDVSKGINKSGYFTVKSVFKSHHADMQREFLSTTPKKELQDHYIKGYQSCYPSIQTKNDLTITDDRRKNIITLIEEYEIPNAWIREEAQKKWFVDIMADEFETYLNSKNITTDRKAPLALFFPRYVYKKTEVILPEREWNFTPEVTTITDPAFEFKREEKVKDYTFSVSYSYKSINSYVEPRMFNSYLENSRQASNKLALIIQQFDQSSSNSTVQNKDIVNWPILFLTSTRRKGLEKREFIEVMTGTS